MKKILLIICFIFLTGCNKEAYIETVIKNKNGNLSTITYPVTHIKKLDKEINKYIKEKELDTSNELNIDYTFNIISNRYVNVTLETYQNIDNQDIYDAKSFIFDKRTNKFLTIANLVSKDSIKTISQIINKKASLNSSDYTNVTFDENNLYFYFNVHNLVTKVDVPIYDTEFLLDINFGNEVKKEYNSYNKEKVIDPDKPVVALTFDDGPSKYTDDILDILDENDANATFFVLGNKVKYYSNTLRKMLKNGNEIGNHTFNHKSLNRLKIDDMLYQINSTQDIIYEYTGYTPLYLRPSYGNINHLLKEKTPLEIILWNVDPEDWKYKNSKVIANRALNKVNDGSIVLLHDTKKRTVEALKIIIKELKKEGYQFVTISELKEIKEIRKRIKQDE